MSNLKVFSDNIPQTTACSHICIRFSILCSILYADIKTPKLFYKTCTHVPCCTQITTHIFCPIPLTQPVYASINASITLTLRVYSSYQLAAVYPVPTYLSFSCLYIILHYNLLPRWQIMISTSRTSSLPLPNIHHLFPHQSSRRDGIYPTMQASQSVSDSESRREFSSLVSV
jgi:hypothetical protein